LRVTDAAGRGDAGTGDAIARSVLVLREAGGLAFGLALPGGEPEERGGMTVLLAMLFSFWNYSEE
jgi:hypothetical protein